MCTGLALLGVVVRNDWSVWVVTTLAMVGLGEGALAVLLITALTSVTRDVCEEVEPLCDATSHFAAAVGAALVGAILVGILSMSVQRQLARAPVAAHELRTYLDLQRVAFVSNNRLLSALESTAATPEQIAHAVRINTDARLSALKLSFFALAGVAAIVFLPVWARGRAGHPSGNAAAGTRRS